MGDLQVTIQPLASAYFAGETVTVHITLTNVRPRPATPGPRRHKSSQSVAQPRTPFTAPPDFLLPRQHTASNIRTPLSASFAALPQSVRDDLTLPTRKGLIGSKVTRPEAAPLKHGGLYGSKRWPAGHKAQNYSVALSGSHDLDDVSAQQAALNYMGQISIKPPAGSLFPGPTRPDSRSATEAPPWDANAQYTQSPTASTSSHARSLSSALGRSASTSEQDSNEATPRNSVDFYAAGRNESMDSVLRDSLTDWAGRPSLRRTATSPVQSPQSASLWRPYGQAAPPSGNQTLLWAFAQLQGSFEVDETFIKPAEFIAVKRSLFGHPTLSAAPRYPGARSGLIGGGTLNAPSGSDGGSGGGWKDWLWSTPAQAGGGAAESPRRSPGMSVAGSAQGGGTLAERWTRAFSDKSIPILSMPPCVFAVDLVLEPGQSKTCQWLSGPVRC
jgi:hypothetical protein